MEHLKPLLDRWFDLAPVTGKAVADIGCGSGGLLAFLEAQGAVVCGIEPREAAVQEANERLGGETPVVQGGAEDLPWSDQSLDMAVFSMSLHHVPKPHLSAALAEAIRVIKPQGHVVIIEPIAEGASYAVERLIDDEAVVRRDAADAIKVFLADGHATVLIDERLAWHYVYASFDNFISQMVGIDPSRAAQAKAHHDEAHRLFHEGGTQTPQGWRFPQDYRLVIMQPAGS